MQIYKYSNNRAVCYASDTIMAGYYKNDYYTDDNGNDLYWLAFEPVIKLREQLLGVDICFFKTFVEKDKADDYIIKFLKNFTERYTHQWGIDLDYHDDFYFIKSYESDPSIIQLYVQMKNTDCYYTIYTSNISTTEFHKHLHIEAKSSYSLYHRDTNDISINTDLTNLYPINDKWTYEEV